MAASAAEPIALVLFVATRARALVAFGRGWRDAALAFEVERLAGRARMTGMNVAREAIDRAVETMRESTPRAEDADIVP